MPCLRSHAQRSNKDDTKISCPQKLLSLSHAESECGIACEPSERMTVHWEHAEYYF